MPVFVAPSVGLPNFAVVDQGVLMPGPHLTPTVEVIPTPEVVPVPEEVAPVPEAPAPRIYLPKQDRN